MNLYQQQTVLLLLLLMLMSRRSFTNTHTHTHTHTHTGFTFLSAHAQQLALHTWTPVFADLVVVGWRHLGYHFRPWLPLEPPVVWRKHLP